MAVSGILIEEKVAQSSRELVAVVLKVEKAIGVPLPAYSGSIWGPHRERAPGWEIELSLVECLPRTLKAEFSSPALQKNRHGCTNTDLQH